MIQLQKVWYWLHTLSVLLSTQNIDNRSTLRFCSKFYKFSWHFVRHFEKCCLISKIVLEILNSSWPNDAIWQHRSWSTLALVMVWYLRTPSHYQNQYCLIIIEVLWQSPEDSFTEKKLIHQLLESALKSLIQNIFRSPRSQWVNSHRKFKACACLWQSTTLTPAPGRSECNSKNVIFNLLLLICIFRSSHDNAVWWMPQDLTDDKSTLVQVMAWCHQATSHYLSQCWLSSMSPCGIARPQWVNHHVLVPVFSTWRVNIFRLEQNGWHFADNIFKFIFQDEYFCILIHILLNFVIAIDLVHWCIYKPDLHMLKVKGNVQYVSLSYNLRQIC